MVDVAKILAELRAEHERLEEAIRCLESMARTASGSSPAANGGNPPPGESGASQVSCISSTRSRVVGHRPRS